MRSAELALGFDAGLDESSVPAAGAFAVRVASSGCNVSAVAVASQGIVTLTLASAVTAGEAVDGGLHAAVVGEAARRGRRGGGVRG